MLKGLEIRLPAGHEFHDKDGNLRRHIRTRWWRQERLSYRDRAMVPEEDINADSIRADPRARAAELRR
ncbi:hypothetical protein [Franzmannia qiaohouensis]|uniref:Uncharacterized protein n=1 Tax=Franzmannia qiaohouensis TaxID=1329370 RepID=A0ABU1HJA9_9GAMM|nr:hypothetical protein [Halomonas qiaohouensis]MDR5907133.1 hypothetical protein [Halomonas qiaohouensis]